MKFDVVIGNSAFVKENAEYFANEYSKMLFEKQANAKDNTNKPNKEIYVRKQK